jgi:hypothetical protein
MEPPTIRWANGKGYKDNPDFWKCICEVGWENIKHEIVANGLDSGEARKLETKLILQHNTLTPNGFNRRCDHAKPYVPRKKEVGRRFGHTTVLDYFPDENRYKVYELRCDCGNVFRCHVFDLKENQSCGCFDKQEEVC